MKPPATSKMTQTCYSYTMRALAEHLNITLTPQQWVIVEIDGDQVDVMVREWADDAS